MYELYIELTRENGIKELIKCCTYLNYIAALRMGMRCELSSNRAWIKEDWTYFNKWWNAINDKYPYIIETAVNHEARLKARIDYFCNQFVKEFIIAREIYLDHKSHGYRFFIKEVIIPDDISFVDPCAS